MFLSTAGRPILPLSFRFGVDRGHAHDGKDGAHHRAGDGDLGKLEGDGVGVTHDTRPDHDQLELQAGQRPVGHGLRQFDAAQEGGQVVDQRVQLQSHLVVTELLA